MKKKVPGSGFDDQVRLIFQNIFDFYGTLDLEGRVETLAGRIFELTNTDPNLLAGQRFYETVFWQSSENTPKILETAIENAATGESSKLLLDFRVSADEKLPLEVNLQYLDGRNEIFVCAQSVAERKRRTEHHKLESEQLLSAAENAEIGLWFWDFSEEHIYATPRCSELLGLPAYDLLTYEKFLSVIHPDDHDFVIDFLSRSRSEGAKYEEEFRVIYPDGSIEWICTEGKSFLDSAGEPLQMMGVVRKITEQKIAAAELSKVYEREKKARDEAVEANRTKDFFLAFVSHELRSPLNAISGWSKILLTKKVDEETRKNALETIERSARFQTKLINDLVDSARVASGKLRLEYRPTNLCEIVRMSFQGQKPAAEAHNLQFEFISPLSEIRVFGDAGRLQQVFGNLISNAIKFTPEGGRVSIEIESDTNVATVHVSDTGQGISADALPNIFKQFSQGEGNLSKNVGLGLGLSIVNILVAKHGGSVRAESSGIGQGSRFSVTLPLTEKEARPEASAADEAVPKEKPLQGLRILIVEDNLDSREVLELFLEKSGAVVSSTESAIYAFAELEKMNGSLPDLIISDLAMPDEDGYSLLTRIRSLPEDKGGSVPAIALSAFATVESKQRAFESGFQRYLTKPFEPDSLVREILDLLRK